MIKILAVVSQSEDKLGLVSSMIPSKKGDISLKSSNIPDVKGFSGSLSKFGTCCTDWFPSLVSEFTSFTFQC